MKAKPFVAAVLSAGILAGCAQQGPYGSADGGYGLGGMGSKQTVGTVLGGVAGGLAGSRFGGGAGKLAAVGIGTLLGAALGNAAGSSLDRADVAYAQRAEVQAYNAPTGSTIRWNNPQNGNWGTYTPTREGTGPSGEYCREYQTTFSVGGQIERGTGTACRQPDGTWRVVS
ncbi:MAG TPA: RT0821/Lpp0805 family surface protein [Azospirillum sp.]|nr:RT0821/Lpp0805 family surface protein [Azospirillum sp.]